MNTAVSIKQDMGDAVARLILHGDLSKLSDEQKVSYYKSVCESIGLNPITKPFDYMEVKTPKGEKKEILYANKTCTDQLRKIHAISITVTSREMIGDVYVVTARAKFGDREDESTGAVPIKNLLGDALANAYMKAETKAKRRVTLSICGLGMLDESEVETIPGARKTEEAKVVEPKQLPAEPGAKKNGHNTEARDLGSYRIKAGIGGKNAPLRGKMLSEIDPDHLQKTFDYWAGKEINGLLAEDMAAIAGFLDEEQEGA